MRSLPLSPFFTLTFQISHQNIAQGSRYLILCSGQSSVNLAYSNRQNGLGKYSLDIQSVYFKWDRLADNSFSVSENSLSKDVAEQNAQVAVYLKLNLVYGFLISTSVKNIYLQNFTDILGKKCFILPPIILVHDFQISFVQIEFLFSKIFF